MLLQLGKMLGCLRIADVSIAWTMLLDQVFVSHALRCEWTEIALAIHSVFILLSLARLTLFFADITLTCVPFLNSLPYCGRLSQSFGLSLEHWKTPLYSRSRTYVTRHRTSYSSLFLCQHIERGTAQRR